MAQSDVLALLLFGVLSFASKTLTVLSGRALSQADSQLAIARPIDPDDPVAQALGQLAVFVAESRGGLGTAAHEPRSRR